MTSRVKRLKKSLVASLIKAAIITVGLIVALVSAYYFYQDIQENAKQLKLDDRRLQNQIRSSKARNNKEKNTLELYKKLTKDSNLQSLTLNRKSTSLLLKNLSAKYGISNYSINIAPLIKKTEGSFSKKTGTIVTTRIDINFYASSDVQAFAFTEELLNKFSGYLNIKSFSLDRSNDISEGVLRNLLNNGKSDFIKGSLSFDWLGLRVHAKNDNGGAR